MSGIILAAALVGGTGLLLGLFLGFSGKIFKVEVDEKEIAVRGELPGSNCGGCGFAGCDACAKAIVAGTAEVGACPVGGAPAALRIGEILGKSAGEAKHMTAYVKCAGTCDKTRINYDYCGAKDCEMLSFVPSGGPKACNHGCLGYGTCVKVCPFDAIHVVNGVAVVDKEKCKACGKCVAHCPKALIELIPYEQEHMVQCSSKDKGKLVMAGCDVGCIGCKKCERTCQAGAISITDNVAHIDPEKCTNCGACVQACPRKIIQ